MALMQVGVLTFNEIGEEQHNAEHYLVQRGGYTSKNDKSGRHSAELRRRHGSEIEDIGRTPLRQLTYRADADMGDLSLIVAGLPLDLRLI